ncbi:Carbohydrate ABC transporter substrate-binding protein (CUT1 family) [Hyphomicrobiales bacterium]|nr:Carbohydrate ABC transporter substrate-binding protein (CUT1 family) [Hyphomicrobiales bacterium]CAH1694486.1 Carbohydrate ABC transporter substrate-binding protein (CUT1 family) [Hyphomicrobiales bacterium]
MSAQQSRALRSRAVAFAGIFASLIVAQPLAAQTTVTMWTFLDPNKTSPREVALKEIIAGFEATNPSIKIKVEPQDFAQMPPKFFLGHRTGGNPDLVWIDAKNLGGLSQSGAGADLNALTVNKWSQAERDDFFVKAGWNAALKNGKLMAMPLFHGASVIYYRKDLLKAAGIDPASLTSWDALAAAAKKLTTDKDGDGRVDVWGFGMPLAAIKTESTPVLIGMLDQEGGPFNACKANYATPEGIKSLTFTADLITKDKVTPQEALVQNVDDITEQFTAGRYAMAITSNLRFSVIAKAAAFGGDNIGIIAWPSWSGKKPAPMPVSGWWIAAWQKSPRLAEASKFIDYLASTDSIAKWMTVGGQVPIRKSLLDSPFLKQPANGWMTTMVDTWSTSSWMEPTECNTRTLQSALNEAVSRVVLDKVEPKTALQEAEHKFADAQ